MATARLIAFLTTWPNRLALVIWIILIGLGALALAFLEPREEAAGAEQWPASSGLARAGQRPCAVVFLHTGCTCTPFVAEAARRVLKQLPADLRAFVVVERPPRSLDKALAPPDAQPELDNMGGADVVPDPSGVEARAFGATGAGELRLYGADGLLRYRGLVQAAGQDPAALNSELVAALSADVSHPVALSSSACALLPEECASERRH